MGHAYKEVSTDVRLAPPWWSSCRVILSFVGFLSFFAAYSHRVGMSVAIVCMVNHTAVKELREDGLINESRNLSAMASHQDELMSLTSTLVTTIPDSKISEQCVRYLDENSTTQEQHGTFVWDKRLQGHILGSFFYGYVISQIPGGLLAERFGAKWVFFAFQLLSTISTLLTPLAATLGPWTLVAIRVLCGIGSGGLFPSMHVLLTNWSPLEERSRLAGFTYSGAWVGNIVTFPLAGLLCMYGFGGGWPSIFYTIGLISVFVLVLWVFLVHSTPACHPRITEGERVYIQTSLKGIMQNKSDNEHLPTPWLYIIRSPAVWAIILANITTDWGLYTFLTNIPTYMYEVLFFDITKNGALSALPFIGCFVVVLITPILADKLIYSKVLSINWTRKLMNSTGAIGGAVFTLALSFFTCDQALLAVVTLTLGVSITGCVYSGFGVNYMDIAPRFVGTIFGIGNCLAALTGFIAPYTVAVLTPNQTQEEWRRVFYVSAAIYMFGALFFLVFSKGNVQSWAMSPGEKLENRIEKEKKKGARKSLKHSNLDIV